MPLLKRRKLVTVLLACLLLFTSITPALAHEIDDTYSIHTHDGNPQQLDEGSVDEIPEDNTTPVEKDADTVYAFMNMLNGVFDFGYRLSSYTQANPVSLHIHSTITVTERVPSPPLINQMKYPNDPYGRYGSIASHGCGIACLTMAASYLLDEELDVVEMADKFGAYNTERGSYWKLFEDSAQVLGLELQERTYSRRTVMEALANGQIVIALQSEGLFTSGGHFILLTGLTENGRITVNDPNGWNWNKNTTLRYGFKYGFTERQIFANGGPYWIYEPKEVKIDTLNDERVTVEYQLQIHTNPTQNLQP